LSGHEQFVGCDCTAKSFRSEAWAAATAAATLQASSSSSALPANSTKVYGILGMTYAGDKVVSVLILEDGEMFGVTVRARADQGSSTFALRLRRPQSGETSTKEQIEIGELVLLCVVSKAHAPESKQPVVEREFCNHPSPTLIAPARTA
jgi:hypothetical protein